MRVYQTTYEADWGDSSSSSETHTHTSLDSAGAVTTVYETYTESGSGVGTTTSPGTATDTYTSTNFLFYSEVQQYPTSQTISSSSFTEQSVYSYVSGEFPDTTVFEERSSSTFWQSWTSYTASSGISVTNATSSYEYWTTSVNEVNSYSTSHNAETYTLDVFLVFLSSSTSTEASTDSYSFSDTYYETGEVDPWTYTTTSTSTYSASGTSASTGVSTLTFASPSSSNYAAGSTYTGFTSRTNVGSWTSTSPQLGVGGDTVTEGLTRTYSASTSESNSHSTIFTAWSYTESYSESYYETQSYSSQRSMSFQTSRNRSGRTTTQFGSTSFSATTYGSSTYREGASWSTTTVTGSGSSLFTDHTTYLSTSEVVTSEALAALSATFLVGSVSDSTNTTATITTAATWDATYTTGSGTGTGLATYTSFQTSTRVTTTTQATTVSSYTQTVTITVDNFVRKEAGTVFERDAGERLFSLTASAESSMFVLSEVLAESHTCTYTATTTSGGMTSDSNASVRSAHAIWGEGGPALNLINVSVTSASGRTAVATRYHSLTEGIASIAVSPSHSPYFGGEASSVTSVTYGPGVHEITSQTLPAGAIGTARTTFTSTTVQTYASRNMRVHQLRTASFSAPSTVYTTADIRRLGVFSFNTASLASP